MGKLDGKIAIVTGGGTGIGRSTALMLAAEGAHVVVAGRRRPPLEAVVAEIAKAGGRAAAREADVAKPAQGRALAEWAVKEFGHVDILINNAGHSSKARNVRWVGQEEWDAVIAVNLTGVYALTQAVLPSMIGRGGGAVVTVGSYAALRPGLIGGAPYGAAGQAYSTSWATSPCSATSVRDRGDAGRWTHPFSTIAAPAGDDAPAPR
jgi:NAD(P)-dependent dehydrogenase (short-subunit alcohol dehydrogenase family)